MPVLFYALHFCAYCSAGFGRGIHAVVYHLGFIWGLSRGMLVWEVILFQARMVYNTYKYQRRKCGYGYKISSRSV